MAPPRRPDLVDVVDDLLPTWRAHRAPRSLVIARPTRSGVVGGRTVEFDTLPAVGTGWFRRDGRYWRRRGGFALLLAVAVLVFVLLDVGVAAGAASSSSGALAGLVAGLVVTFAASSLLYWRADLFARTGVPGTHPWPGPLKAVGVVLGGLGMIVTPGYALGLLVDQLLRFPAGERVAWEHLVGQLGTGAAASH